MGQTLDWPPGKSSFLRNVVQGDFRVSSDEGEVCSTLLGSCVSVCLYDLARGIGGLNHYLLPETAQVGNDQMRYGGHAMELLINGLLKIGADRKLLRAKVFGGARMTERYAEIGQRNAEFAQRYLASEGIEIVSSDTGGRMARRLHFHPVSGQVRVMHIATDPDRDRKVPSQKDLAPTKPTESITLF